MKTLRKIEAIGTLMLVLSSGLLTSCGNKTVPVYPLSTVSEKTEAISPPEVATATVEPTLTFTPTLTSTNTQTSTVTPTPTMTPTSTPFKGFEQTPTPRVLLDNRLYLVPGSGWETFNLHPISITEAQVQNIVIEGNEIVISMRTMIGGKNRILHVRTKGFQVYDRYDGNAIYITKNNIEEFSPFRRISPSFFYLSEPISTRSRKAFYNTCNYDAQNEGEQIAKDLLQVVCDNMKRIEETDSGGKIYTVGDILNWLNDKESDEVDIDGFVTLYRIDYESE